jgi:hypothetical protein
MLAGLLMAASIPRAFGDAGAVCRQLRHHAGGAGGLHRRVPAPQPCAGGQLPPHPGLDADRRRLLAGRRAGRARAAPAAVGAGRGLRIRVADARLPAAGAGPPAPATGPSRAAT